MCYKHYHGTAKSLPNTTERVPNTAHKRLPKYIKQCHSLPWQAEHYQRYFHTATYYQTVPSDYHVTPKTTKVQQTVPQFAMAGGILPQTTKRCQVTTMALYQVTTK